MTNESAELDDARSEAADSLRTLDAIAEYVGCPQDEELTVDHVRQHYIKLETAAQRQGVEDANRFTSAEARLREAHSAFQRLAADCHRSKWHFDFDEELSTGAQVTRRLVRKAFDELQRIGNIAMHERDALKALAAGGDEAKKSEESSRRFSIGHWRSAVPLSPNPRTPAERGASDGGSLS